MLLWAIGQHLLLHKTGRRWSHLSALNTYVDITAVSLLLLGYGLFGMPDLAVKSPMWTAYLRDSGRAPVHRLAVSCRQGHGDRGRAVRS